VAGETHTLEVPPGMPLSEVREYLRSLNGPASARVQENLAVLTTEVVMNALRHGEPPVVVETTWLAGTARVSVQSRGAPFRWRRQGSEPQRAGFGLLIVDSMADRWGIDHIRGANRVWLEVDHDAYFEAS